VVDRTRTASWQYAGQLVVRVVDLRGDEALTALSRSGPKPQAGCLRCKRAAPASLKPSLLLPGTRLGLHHQTCSARRASDAMERCGTCDRTKSTGQRSASSGRRPCLLVSLFTTCDKARSRLSAMTFGLHGFCPAMRSRVRTAGGHQWQSEGAASGSRHRVQLLVKRKFKPAQVRSSGTREPEF